MLVGTREAGSFLLFATSKQTRSLYVEPRRQHRSHFIAIQREILGSDSAPEPLKKLIRGYQLNLLGMFGNKGAALPELLQPICEHASAEQLIEQLSELGYVHAIARRIDQYLPDAPAVEQDYWSRRLALAEELDPAQD